MKTHFAIFLLFTLVITSCRPTAESKKQENLKKFNKAIELANVSVSLGMTHSNVVTILGQPFLTDTQSQKGWVVDIYHYYPPALHFGVITDGFEITFSNNIVIDKKPIRASMQ